MDYLPAFGIYVFMTIAVLMIGTMQGSWLAFSDQEIMSFRKPKMLRLGAGIASLVFLAVALFFVVSAIQNFNVYFKAIWNAPLDVMVASFFAFFAGPQDVSVNLHTGNCCKVDGWIFRPRKSIYQITAASSVSVCSGGQTYYVYLMIGGNTKQWFLLARPAQKTDALLFAQEVADRLNLSIKETDFRHLSELS